MNWLRAHKKITTLLTVLLVLIILTVVSYKNIGENTSLGRSMEHVIAFIQGPVSGAGNGVKTGAKGILQFRSVLKENEQLKEQVAELNREIIRLKLSKTELEELKSLSEILGYPNIADNYTLVSADVIAMDGSNWFNIFTINAGADQGVRKDDVIISGENLIGRVLETGDNWSKVISVIDESNSVSFKVLRDMALLGILSGDGKGGLAGYMLDPDGAVIEGDVLISSGMGMYPEGIVIGKVSEVVWNNDTLLKTLKIEPGAYFKNLQKVTVLVD